MKHFKITKFNKLKEGFTLIELLAVLVILGLISSIMFIFIGGVFTDVDDTLDITTKNIILDATNAFVLEFRGNSNWVEKKDDVTGNVDFCISLDSLIESGYFRHDSSNYEEYRDDYLVKGTFENGIYDYEFVRRDDLPNSHYCKYDELESDFSLVNNEQIDIVDNTFDIGNFDYNINKEDSNKYLINYGLDLNLINIVDKNVYVIFALDRSTSMNCDYSVSPCRPDSAKFNNAVESIIGMSSLLYDNIGDNYYNALVEYNSVPKLVLDFNNRKIIENDILPIDQSGTNTPGVFDLITSMICVNGLSKNSDLDWCNDLRKVEINKDFDLYVILLFDGNAGYYSYLDLGVDSNGDGIKDFLSSNNIDTSEKKYQYYSSFFNNDRMLKSKSKDYYDLLAAEWSISPNYLKETGAKLIQIGYDCSPAYEVRMFSSIDNDLCANSYHPKNKIPGTDNYCYYKAAIYDGRADVESIISLGQRISDSLIQNISTVKSIRFVVEPKDIYNDKIRLFKGDNEVHKMEIIVDNIDVMDDNFRDDGTLSFELVENAFGCSESEFNNNKCLKNDVELFDMYIELNYDNGDKKRVDLTTPKFELMLNRISTVN